LTVETISTLKLQARKTLGVAVLLGGTALAEDRKIMPNDRIQAC
jgi:hypothetical protein